MDNRSGSQSSNNKEAQGDWYLYDGTKVSGPFSDAEMRAQYESSTLNLFASKKGFSKWYTAEEVQNFFEKSESDAPSEEVLAFRRMFESNLSQLQKLQDSKPSTFDTEPHGQTTLKKVEPTRIATALEQNIAEETFRTPSGIKQDIATYPTEEKATNAVDTAQQIVSSPKNQTHRDVKKREFARKTTDPKELYMLLRGRLRLGQITNNFEAGVLQYFFTLSFSSMFWAKRVRQEMYFHTTGKFKRSSFVEFLHLVPIVNLFCYYSTARMLHRMETQNHYQKTHPWIVFFLALVPPLAISYLQENINKHWMLHVVNVRRKQKAKNKN